MDPRRTKRFQFDIILTLLLLLSLAGMGWFGMKLVRTLTIADEMPGWQWTIAELDYFRLTKVVHHSGDFRTTVMYKPKVSYRYRTDDTPRRSTSFMLMDRTNDHVDIPGGKGSEDAETARRLA